MKYDVICLVQHGRIKVRTSEEEKARKEKERQEKLKVYKHAMHQILTKVRLTILKYILLQELPIL